MVAIAPPRPIFDIELAEREARRSVEALADGLADVVRVARALAQSGNSIDLTGLDGLFGSLCARALDLTPDHGRRLAPRLLALRDNLDALSAGLSRRTLN